MGDLRSKEGQAKYDAYKANGGLLGGCRLCEAPHLETFSHWAIIGNLFPYDRIAREHVMIIPLRCVKESEITEAE